METYEAYTLQRNWDTPAADAMFDQLLGIDKMNSKKKAHKEKSKGKGRAKETKVNSSYKSHV